MKKVIIMAILASLTASYASATILELNKAALTTRIGLYSALDSVTGYNQIYYRSLAGRSTVQLTSTDSDKSVPKWGPSRVTYYFYDRVENEILTCEGRLFYYLQSGDSGQNDLFMGCVSSDSAATPAIIEGYPLTGLGSGPMDVQGYEVAEGAELSYEFEETTHEAYPIIVETAAEDTILLHDDQANLGSTNYEDGFVVYYDDNGFDDSVPGWTSSIDDEVEWDGAINCPRCQDNVAGGRPNEHDNIPGDSETEASDTDIDVNYDDSDQTTEVGNENQNTSSVDATVSGETSAENTINISVTVEVDSINTNTSESASSSVSGGTISSTSANTTSSAAPVDAANDAPAADIALDTASPVSGGMEMVGGGGCSLSRQSSKSPSVIQLSVMSLVLAVGMLWVRNRAYEQSL